MVRTTIFDTLKRRKSICVKRTVFPSRSERENYRKLCRTWEDKYSIYHNLPFLNVFTPQDLHDWTDWAHPHVITLSDLEVARLKKTSIDFTLCDENDAPIVCIEFDGLQQGFNVGTRYVTSGKSGQYPDPWRDEIMSLKLKVAYSSLFPYFVVGSQYFEDLARDIKLTMVDGIIGEIMTQRAIQNKFGTMPGPGGLPITVLQFDPLELGYTQEEFDSLLPDEQQELIQDWIISMEVDTEFEHNPITRQSWSERMEFLQSKEIISWSIQPVHYPTVDTEDYGERRKQIKSAILNGTKVILRTQNYGEIEATAWLPNFQAVDFVGGVLEEIVFMLALRKLKRMKNRSR